MHPLDAIRSLTPVVWWIGCGNYVPLRLVAGSGTIGQSSESVEGLLGMVVEILGCLVADHD